MKTFCLSDTYIFRSYMTIAALHLNSTFGSQIDLELTFVVKIFVSSIIIFSKNRLKLFVFLIPTFRCATWQQYPYIKIWPFGSKIDHALTFEVKSLSHPPKYLWKIGLNLFAFFLPTFWRTTWLSRCIAKFCWNLTFLSQKMTMHWLSRSNHCLIHHNIYKK